MPSTFSASLASNSRLSDAEKPIHPEIIRGPARIKRRQWPSGPEVSGLTGPLMPPENGLAVVEVELGAGPGLSPDDPPEQPVARTAAVMAALISEVRRTLLEVGGDRLDLVGTADEPADGPFLGGEALGQRHGAGQVQERLGPPHRVR